AWWRRQSCSRRATGPRSRSERWTPTPTTPTCRSTSRVHCSRDRTPSSPAPRLSSGSTSGPDGSVASGSRPRSGVRRDPLGEQLAKLTELPLVEVLEDVRERPLGHLVGARERLGTGSGHGDARTP